MAGDWPTFSPGSREAWGATGSLLDDLPGDPGLGAAAGGLLTQRTKAATFSPQSLTGHTSPVESVRLNTPEELIVAGSQSGSIRVWDLEAAKSRGLHLPPPNACLQLCLSPAFPSSHFLQEACSDWVGCFSPGSLTQRCVLGSRVALGGHPRSSCGTCFSPPPLSLSLPLSPSPSLSLSLSLCRLVGPSPQCPQVSQRRALVGTFSYLYWVLAGVLAWRLMPSVLS